MESDALLQILPYDIVEELELSILEHRNPSDIVCGGLFLYGYRLCRNEERFCCAALIHVSDLLRYPRSRIAEIATYFKKLFPEIPLKNSYVVVLYDGSDSTDRTLIWISLFFDVDPRIAEDRIKDFANYVTKVLPAIYLGHRIEMESPLRVAVPVLIIWFYIYKKTDLPKTLQRVKKILRDAFIESMEMLQHHIYRTSSGTES